LSFLNRGQFLWSDKQFLEGMKEESPLGLRRSKWAKGETEEV
jgi:hypothetical protein